MRILVADDSKTNLAILINSLTHLGHEVIAARNGAEAIALFKKQRPDLVILDVVMEEMDGFECAKRIRELNTEDWIPIIFLSGAVDDENISRGINAGGDDYITKPFSDITLAAKIKAMQRISDMRLKLCATTQKLSILSSIDPITSIYNRMEFNKKIIEKTDQAKRNKQPLALLYIDIDHFKRINDSLGHHVGDFILKETASRIMACIRENDILARLGGDEFAIILPNLGDSEKASHVAQKIIDALRPVYKIAGHEIRISCSIGIACFSSPDQDFETLLQNADVAMYHAKEKGRNNYQFYTPKLNEQQHQRLSLKQALKASIDTQEFQLTYQGIFDLRTRRVKAVEALLHWKHPELGLIQPENLIPLAEESGLIVALNEKILEKVGHQGSAWQKISPSNFKLLINLTSRQLLQESLPDLLRRIIEKTKISPALLELEINECTLMANVIHSEKILMEIAKLGISICIDHFGTGYSSLSYLKSLPVRSLKIDRVFIRDLGVNPQTESIVNALVHLGLNLGLTVIAEGVETEEQCQFLLKFGCPQGQGTYLSKPLEGSKMTALLSEEEPVTG